jgi:hypothetical protein
MVASMIGGVVGLAVCLTLVYITRQLSVIVDSVDSASD